MSERHHTVNNILVLQLADQSDSFLYDAESENTTQILYTHILVVHSVDWRYNLHDILYVDRYM